MMMAIVRTQMMMEQMRSALRSLLSHSGASNCSILSTRKHCLAVGGGLPAVDVSFRPNERVLTILWLSYE